MWVSLNEVEQTSMMAARGAGYAFSLAGEAGSAARWLAMRGLPFLEPLCTGVLSQMHRLESFTSARQVGSSYGPTDVSRRFGPISVLTALLDGALGLPTGTEELSIRSLAAPALVLPVLARLSKSYDRPLLVRWPGVAVECRAGFVLVDDARSAALGATHCDWLVVSRMALPFAKAEEANCLRHHGANVDETHWRELRHLANRTYTPESETVRRRGAGAGFIDNE